MRCDFGGVVQEKRDVSLEGQVVHKKDTFRYLGSMLQRDGDINADISHKSRVDQVATSFWHSLWQEGTTKAKRQVL